jgi:hypothetical protein
MRLVEPATIRAAHIQHPRARQHLKEGFNRRVLMLDACIRRIHDRADEAGGRPLSALLMPEFAVFVNSLWLNMCGALDNLAWALNYEFGLLPEAREDKGRERRDVVLFGKRFLAALVAIDRELATGLQAFAAWQTELATLRDPGAHRIPIYPIPGVLDEATGEAAQRLYDESDALFKAGDYDAGMERLHQGSNLGSYQPYIALSHDGRTEFRHLVSEMRRDEESFVGVAELVLARLFS